MSINMLPEFLIILDALPGLFFPCLQGTGFSGTHAPVDIVVPAKMLYVPVSVGQDPKPLGTPIL